MSKSLNPTLSAQLTTSARHCFHCGEDVPAGLDLSAIIAGQPRPMCCIGCQAAAELIETGGMGDFYRLRGDQNTAGADRAREVDSGYWRQFDQAELSQDYLRRLENNQVQASIDVQGMYCSACAWLIDKTLNQLQGVSDLLISPSQRRLRISWNREQLRFSDILLALARLGYQPKPLAPLAYSNQTQLEQRSALKRLAVAGMGMMQVMMYAVGLYAGEFQGIDAAAAHFLNLVSMLVATAVVFYAGAPFFANALRDIRSRHLGMDVPVALAIGAAYGASVFNTLSGNGGTVYFDSALMFIFFLSLGRFLEMRARHQASSSAEALRQLLPPLVRVQRGERSLSLPPQQLQPGDCLSLQAGDTVPCDGEVLTGQASFDEALLTGEARPQTRTTQDPVLAGAILQAGTVEMRVTRQGQDTVLAQIAALLDKSLAQRPARAELANQVARYFVMAVLLLAGITGLIWWQIDPSRVFPTVLAVLVVTCPCALSLATPTALTAASNYLSRRGVLLTNGNALEKLLSVKRWCFDKTGTLTAGNMQLEHSQLLGSENLETCLNIAATLEQRDNHSIAAAFFNPALTLDNISTKHSSGNGVQGMLNQQYYRIGRLGWVAELCRQDLPEVEYNGGYTIVALASESEWLAVFYLSDQLRDGSRELIAGLQADSCVEIISGDNPTSVARTAERLGVQHYEASLLPEQKLQHLHALQSTDMVVAMVGDGINDAPVLAQADVSIALASGSQLAQSAADIVLLGGHLHGIADARITARRCMQIIRQNLSWALCYNLGALPLAALGLISPWMAAIGMSASSLLVVLNASRLNHNGVNPS